MYKVTNTLTSAYGPQDMDLRSKQGPVSLLKHILFHKVQDQKLTKK